MSNFIEQFVDMGRFNRFFKENKKKLVLFGSSKLAGDFLEYVDNHGPIEGIDLDIEYICNSDPSKAGTVIPRKGGKGSKFITIKDLEQMVGNVKILITSKYAFEILQLLRSIHVEDSDIFYPMHKDYLCGLPVSDGFTLPKYYTKMLAIISHQNELAQVHSWLGDDRSKEVFRYWIAYRFEFKQAYLDITQRGEKMYFNKEFLNLTDHEVLIDVGAYVGDSAVDFILNVNNRYDHIYLIEPEEKALKKCYDMLLNPDTKDKISFYSFGVSSEHKVTSIIHDGGSVSYCRVWTLDQFFSDKRITLIKMDIEGMEEEALLGAKEIIQSQKPKLAICIYHLEDDIWKLPMLIKQLNPDYKLYIRHNHDCDGEVVLYAT